ncbi:hypothetical protein VTN77DRAFT_4462 [Rasamsonia byssochlamydoides]|uniref:uncharacterized protein n=1 Tax=Rasamsonia byssochlamydoides TaxID=89139 RepID=UPI003743745B
MDSLFNYLSPFILFGCLVFVLLRVYHSFNNPLSALPGPTISKWSSVVITYYWFIGQRAQYVHSLHQKYGPIVRVSPDEVDICDLAAARDIHRVGGRFVKSEWYRRLVPHAIENVFSTTDPKLHSFYRRLLSSPITDASLKRFEPVIIDRVRFAIAKIAEELRTHGAADVFKWWTFMATDVIGELSFGESFRMLEYGKYSLDLECIASLQPIRTTFPFLIRLSEVVPLPMFRSAAEAGWRLSNYAQQSIERYRKLIALDPTAKSTLLTKLFNAEEDGLSDTEIRNQAQGYIVAGSDTTAVTLTYLVYSVCRDKTIRDRLVAEVSSLAEDFTEKDIRELPYLNQVINETLRLYSAVPSALPRVVPPERAYLAGYQLPAGVTVSTQAYSFHRDPRIFPDPERFNPSRWASPTKEMKEAFMPFGAGSRICLGMHLARIELRLATALFFRTFLHATVSAMTDEDDDMKPKMFFLLSPKGHRCLIQDQVD